MKKGKIDLITMGCAKNLVDSERLMAMLEARGWRCCHDGKRVDGEVAVVNTCGFIEAAKQESIDMILRLAELKRQGKIGRLIVMGCLSERYMGELREELPEVDRFYGKFDFRQLASDLGEASAGVTVAAGGRKVVTPRHYAYLKVSEGCDRGCTYCAIPQITGRQKSRTMEDIVEEARALARGGARELIVIAQDLTAYGTDLYGERRIAPLVERIADVEGVRWIRLHYGYPKDFPWELARVMRERPNVCKYIDVALQHVADGVLHRMGRGMGREETYDFVRRLRQEVPGICLRTTLMVGFPGETDDDFGQLMEFARWARFERMGAFAYSEEDGTYAANHYKDDVTPEEKGRRMDMLMEQQEEMAEAQGARMVGRRTTVVIDRKEGEYYIGRTEQSSPEVDPEVIVDAGAMRLRRGSFYEVEITATAGVDLCAKVCANDGSRHGEGQ